MPTRSTGQLGLVLQRQFGIMVVGDRGVDSGSLGLGVVVAVARSTS
jgi:hypothetical protein